MLRFPRSDDLSEDRKPHIVDGPATKAWLARMSQPPSVEDLIEITHVLQALGAHGAQDQTAPLAPERKFAIGDRLRGLLLPMLGDRAREDRFMVLPLDDDFRQHFWSTVNAAVALRDVYAWLVSQLPEASVRVEPVADEPPEVHALVTRVGALHRALDVNAYIMLCVQRARWAVPAILWERHCALGQLVRELDCQDVEVMDALRVSATKTCRAAFVLPAMIALADPAARTSVEFEMIRMAAQRWSARVGFRLEKRSDATATPARPNPNPGPTITLGAFVLRLDTQSALHSIDKRLEALAEGRSPREVGIGDSLRPRVALRLLALLKQRWGARAPADIDSPERSWRPAMGPVQAMVGMPGAEGRLHRSTVGTNSESRGTKPYSHYRLDHTAIAQQPAAVEKARIERMLDEGEPWTLVAESADAIRCIRKHTRPRIGLQRLIGLKLDPSTQSEAPFLLGWIEALQATTTTLDDQQFSASSAHSVRVRLAPGLPRLLNASIDDVELECAFLLVPGDTQAHTRDGRPVASVPTVGNGGAVTGDDDGWDAVRASPRRYGLILPQSSFRPQRLVKAVQQGALAMLRLEELMMRGSDFDLVRFTLL